MPERQNHRNAPKATGGQAGKEPSDQTIRALILNSKTLILNATLQSQNATLQTQVETLTGLLQRAVDVSDELFEANDEWRAYADELEAAQPRKRRSARARVCNHLQLVPSGPVSNEVANQRQSFANGCK